MEAASRILVVEDTHIEVRFTADIVPNSELEEGYINNHAELS